VPAPLTEALYPSIAFPEYCFAIRHTAFRDQTQAVGPDDDQDDGYRDDVRKEPAAPKSATSRVWRHYFTKRSGYQDVLKLPRKGRPGLTIYFVFATEGRSENGHAAHVAGKRPEKSRLLSNPIHVNILHHTKINDALERPALDHRGTSTPNRGRLFFICKSLQLIVLS
jgi:hypothetical protein